MKNGYAICFNEWVLDNNIKNELRLLLIISSLCAEKGYCYASNEYLANIFEETEETISRKIKKLEDFKYITIEYEKKGCEVISRKLRLTKISIHDYQKYQSTIDKNVKENNINNINNMNIIYNWEENEKCECMTKNNEVCLRRSSYNINGVNYCNQHSKPIISKLLLKNDVESKSKKFTPPTLEEIEEYCKSRNNSIDAKIFYDYFNEGNWKDSNGNQVKNWKQKIITWEKFNSKFNNKKNQVIPKWFKEETISENQPDDEFDNFSDFIKDFRNE